MGGKGNYKNRSITSKINNYAKENHKGQNIIIYCVDTDRIDNDSESVVFFEEVQKYCLDNKYEFVWFCYEIENVFLGKTISNENKVKEAISYQKKRTVFDDKIIKNMSIIDEKQKTNNKSNLVLVLNKYFKIK